MEEHKNSSFFKSEAWSWIMSILIAVVLAFIIKTFLIDTALVIGSSMAPTLTDGDRLIVNKIGYTIGEPEYGDIVTLHATEDDDYVKRIIGKGGDTIKIEKNTTYRNGEPLSEPYINQETYPDFAEVSVPEGYYFVMGDNRANSSDSRFQSLGFVARSDLVGKVFFRYWPLSHFGFPEQ